MRVAPACPALRPFAAETPPLAGFPDAIHPSGRAHRSAFNGAEA
jgi:hypothetical protein